MIEPNRPHSGSQIGSHGDAQRRHTRCKSVQELMGVRRRGEKRWRGDRGTGSGDGGRDRGAVFANPGRAVGERGDSEPERVVGVES